MTPSRSRLLPTQSFSSPLMYASMRGLHIFFHGEKQGHIHIDPLRVRASKAGMPWSVAGTLIMMLGLPRALNSRRPR